jgi:hypothetical protein
LHGKFASPSARIVLPPLQPAESPEIAFPCDVHAIAGMLL